MLIFYALVKLSPHWSWLSTIPEVCVRLCKGSGGEAEDESLFPELELWLHTGPSKVTVWDNWKNSSHRISQRADKGSVHNLRAAQQQRGGQAGAAATVLGQPAGQSCCLSDNLGPRFWDD